VTPFQHDLVSLILDELLSRLHKQFHCFLGDIVLPLLGLTSIVKVSYLDYSFAVVLIPFLELFSPFLEGFRSS